LDNNGSELRMVNSGGSMRIKEVANEDLGDRENKAFRIKTNKKTPNDGCEGDKENI
jgi:hypothetical protein